MVDVAQLRVRRLWGHHATSHRSYAKGSHILALTQLAPHQRQPDAPSWCYFKCGHYVIFRVNDIDRLALEMCRDKVVCFNVRLIRGGKERAP